MKNYFTFIKSLFQKRKFQLALSGIFILTVFLGCIDDITPIPNTLLTKVPFEVGTELYRTRTVALFGQIANVNRIDTLKLFQGNELIASSIPEDAVATLEFDSERNWQVEFTPEQVGEHKFSLVVVDGQGNSSSQDLTLTINESYNFVVLLTDDQNFDTLQYMPFMQDTVVPQSLNFTEAIITIPVCCPARASLLSGFHGHNTGVLTNPSPNGSRNNFNEQDTVPLHLQRLGYETGFIGKYLHGYNPGFVPPGWTSFVANNEGGQISDWLNLKDITIGSSTEKPNRGRIIRSLRQHLVSYHRDKSTEFIDTYAATDDPFFLYISTYAPHPPATPEAEDANKYLDFKYSGRSFNETDLSDKPDWVQKSQSQHAQCSDRVRYKHLQSLQGVDRMMEDVWKRVEAAGELDRTIFVFTSDNGLTFGEHGLPCDKGMAYEESIRVPFVVRMPDGRIGSSDLLTSVNLDLATTIYDLVGFEKQTDGLSLLPVLNNQTPDKWREYLPIEAYGYLNWRFDTQGVWSGIRSNEWKYVETADDINELYNLKDDPFEMENLITESQYSQVIESMKNRLDQHRGLAITTFELEEVQTGQAYVANLTAWGGAEPYTWSIVQGDLPNGLNLDSQTGVISGTSVNRGRYRFRVRVTSPQQATHRKRDQQFFFDYDLVVK